MNLNTKLFTALLFIVNFAFGQDWITTKITDFATIDFPVESELNESYGETIFSVTDVNAIYVVSLRKLTDQQSQQISKDQIPDLYEGVLRGAIQAANAELISKKNIDVNGILGVEIEYVAPHHPELPSQRFKRIVYINKHIINIDFWPFAKQQDLSNAYKGQFFDSFSFRLDQNIENKEEITENIDDSANSSGFKFGYLIGQIFFILLFIGFLIGLILLIRFLLRRKKKNALINDKPKQTIAKIEKIICNECKEENTSESKYCSRCGYELPKINN